MTDRTAPEAPGPARAGHHRPSSELLAGRPRDPQLRRQHALVRRASCARTGRRQGLAMREVLFRPGSAALDCLSGNRSNAISSLNLNYVNPAILKVSIEMALFTLVSETGILGCRPGDLAMDDGSFASWLGAIRLLTDVQRRTGFMCLALAEADDDVAVVSAEVEQRLPPSVEEISGAIDGEHVGIVSTATGDARPAPASALAAALSRVERAGCPHCA